MRSKASRQMNTDPSPSPHCGAPGAAEPARRPLPRSARAERPQDAPASPRTPFVLSLGAAIDQTPPTGSSDRASVPRHCHPGRGRLCPLLRSLSQAPSRAQHPLVHPSKPHWSAQHSGLGRAELTPQQRGGGRCQLPSPVTCHQPSHRDKHGAAACSKAKVH